MGWGGEVHDSFFGEEAGEEVVWKENGGKSGDRARNSEFDME